MTLPKLDQCAVVGPKWIWAAGSASLGRIPMALPLGASEVFQAVEFDSAGDVGHAWLAVPAPGEIAGLLRLARAGPAGAVTHVEPGVEDLQQEGGQRQVKLVRGG